MPISRSALAKYSQPNVIVAESYEFLSDVINNFFSTGLADREAFLVVPLGDGAYKAERFDRITSRLNEYGEGELYKQVAKLAWLPAVEKVTGIDGRMGDDELARWARRLDGKALVVEENHTFAGLVYVPAVYRGALDKTLFQVYQSFMSGLPALIDDEEMATAPTKGVGEGSRQLEQEGSAESAETAPDDSGEDQGAGSGTAGIEGSTGSGTRPLTVPFHTDIRFANWLKPGETRPLTVQLTREAASASVSAEKVAVGFADEFTPETLVIHLDAPHFTERTESWRKSIEVFSFQDSDKATFILTASPEEGERQISIDFRHRERLIGNCRFVVLVQPDEPTTARAVATDVLTIRQSAPALEFSPDPPAPPDVELRIRADGRRLSFELHSPHPEVDATYAPMGSVELAEDPLQYMQERYNDLNRWAAERPLSEDAVAEISGRLAGLGNLLYEKLFPDKLKQRYWKLVQLRKAGRLKSLHITSDEPWIPWEMLKPVDMDEGRKDDFLAQGWQVSRWLAGPGQAGKLHISDARLVAPDTNLAFVQRERDFFAGLPGRSVRVGEPLRQWAQVRQIAQEGVELLHFSTHGKLNSKSIDRSSILLQDNTELHLEDMGGEAVFGLRAKRPLIFFNTCHGARMGFSLAGLGGWANQMIMQVRAAAFIGALWEVNDTLAAEFALGFYAELQKGKSLGAAFHTARQHIREQSPANSTWLAYTLYGDPNMQVTWGEGMGSGVEGPPSGSQP